MGKPISQSAAVGVALFTEFFGFASGVAGYRRARLIDYKTGKKLVAVAVPTMIVFSLLSQLLSSDFPRVAYGVMMLGLSTYLFLTAPGNVRNRGLVTIPKAAESIPRRHEAPAERVIGALDGKEYKYKVCDQRRGSEGS